MRRVVINLVENAAQAMAETEGMRRIMVASRAAPENFTIIITDTGPGIPPEILSKVFEPPFSTKSFGTGLGLPTVKQLTDEHRGTVTITSESGKGTVVTVRLPRGETQERAA